jgi:DNA polymerase-4
LPGVGKVMEARLAQLGVSTVADLRTLGPATLEQRFGRWGRRLHELSYGIDDHPVQPERPTMLISAEDTFEHDLHLSDLEPHIRRLAEKAWQGYERERAAERAPDHVRIARTVVLKLKTNDFRILTRSFTPPEPPDSLAALADLACALRERVDLPSRTRYRLVGVGLSGFVDADRLAAQSDLFG